MRSQHQARYPSQPADGSSFGLGTHVSSQAIFVFDVACWRGRNAKASWEGWSLERDKGERERSGHSSAQPTGSQSG